MKIILLSDDAIRLEPIPGALTVEAASSEMSYSPFHMLASGLATCTASVLHSWATHAKLSVDDLSLSVRWRFADDPHRVSDIEVILEWPSLPANRLGAARRVAEMCTVHATLTHPPRIAITTGAATPTAAIGTSDARETAQPARIGA
ncbi:MAG: OsmC family protein [Gemmatimonadaceae bacterium]|nr:OsmC family protein [Gemmatimonadaceae bacterium]